MTKQDRSLSECFRPALFVCPPGTGPPRSPRPTFSVSLPKACWVESPTCQDPTPSPWAILYYTHHSSFLSITMPLIRQPPCCNLRYSSHDLSVYLHYPLSSCNGLFLIMNLVNALSPKYIISLYVEKQGVDPRFKK